MQKDKEAYPGVTDWHYQDNRWVLPLLHLGYKPREI